MKSCQQLNSVISLKWWKTCGQIWTFNDGQPRHADWYELSYMLLRWLQSCWRPETWGTLQPWACVHIFLCNSNTRAPTYLILPVSCLVSEVCLVSLQASFGYGWIQLLARKSMFSENQIMLKTACSCGTELRGSSFKKGDLKLTWDCRQSTRKLGWESMTKPCSSWVIFYWRNQ